MVRMGNGGGFMFKDEVAILQAAATLAAEPRYTRRLSDKILIAFHLACDQGDTEVAGELLNVLEFMISRTPKLPTGSERRAAESFVAAHERLWHLRNPALLDC
jgi:hypothetical protein